MSGGPLIFGAALVTGGLQVMAEKASARDATRAHLVVDVAPTQADAQTQMNAGAGQG